MSATQKIVVVTVLSVLLAACGSAPRDRIGSGAGIGAGTGAAIGLLAGGIGVIPGAIIGAAAGGGTGALTDQNEINLGEPVWR